MVITRFHLSIIVSAVVLAVGLPVAGALDVPFTKWLNSVALLAVMNAGYGVWSWLHGGSPVWLEYYNPPTLAELSARYALNDEDDSEDLSEEAEAFVSQMEEFASLDWFLLNHAPARLMYRQRHYWN